MDSLLGVRLLCCYCNGNWLVCAGKTGIEKPMMSSFLETTEDTGQENQWLVVREE